MILHNGRGLTISVSPNGLKDAADHLNWLAKGSTNKEAYTLHSHTNNPYLILKRPQCTVDRTA